MKQPTAGGATCAGRQSAAPGRVRSHAPADYQYIDSVELIICVGFLWLVMPCSLVFDSKNEVEGHDSMAAGD